MTLRENVMAILNYQPYERMPLVSFGYWPETLDAWAEAGHVRREDAENYRMVGDNGPGDQHVMAQLGFDFNWNSCVGSNNGLIPAFTPTLLETEPSGAQIMRDSSGLIVRTVPGVISIPSEVGTTLTDRHAWETEYLPRLQMLPERIDFAGIRKARERQDLPLGLHCGSLIGDVRNLLGVVHLSYLYADDEELYREVVDTFAGLMYEGAKRILEESGVSFDYAHFWEDICYKNGPLVSPAVFEEIVAPHYKRFTNLLKAHGISIVSVDCDGCIDRLVPIWLANGVNTMFPIEVGTWGGNIGDWRAKYGKDLRGVGGMNKTVFAKDRKAVEEEVERLRPLIALGGYLPCPDHRIAPDAKFELVAYYCELMKKIL